MNAKTFNRLHALRMENDAARYAQEEMRPRFDRMADRHENGTAPRAVCAYQLFQTPPAIASHLAGLLGLQSGERILEPSAGLGRLLDAVKPFSPSEVVAVEVATNLCGELYKQERDGVTLKQGDFLAMDPYDTGLFDAVIMNPPFHMRADIKHIQHALTFLKAGGRLAAICLDTPQRREAFQHMARQWIDLPAGTFKETGTHVPTCMMLI